MFMYCDPSHRAAQGNMKVLNVSSVLHLASVLFMFCSNTPQSEGSVCRTRERERPVPSKNVGEQQNQEMPFKARTPNYCPRQQIASVWEKRR